MASQVSIIRQHIAEDHPLLAEVFGKHGLDELLNLIEEVVNSKLDEFQRDTEQPGPQLGPN
jgi:hypothetical protein